MEVNSRVVVLDTADGHRIYLPNQQILKQEIVNLSARWMRMSELVLDVAYGTDLDEACRIAEVSSMDGVDASMHRSTALVRSFEESAVRIKLRFWDATAIASELAAVDVAARAVYSAYLEHGIKFAFPQHTLWWGSSQDSSD